MTDLLVDVETVESLADLLGADDLDLRPGAPLPVLWHWAALARWRPWASLGPDGHAEDEAMPTREDLPRRMFAGGEVVVRTPLRIGERVRHEQEVTAVRDTEGRSGPLRFVTVQHTITGDDGGLLRERQDVVYRSAARPGPGPIAGPSDVPGDIPGDVSGAAGAGPVGLDPEWWGFRADAALLMRFSALTRNTHRIHYDQSWATETEGYPDLVVHGPLLTIVLAERLRRADVPVERLRHRGLRPLFAGRSATVHTRETSEASIVTMRAGESDLSELTVPHPVEETS